MIIDKNFKEFIQLLNKNRVKYLVVGGYAVKALQELSEMRRKHYYNSFYSTETEE